MGYHDHAKVSEIRYTQPTLSKNGGHSFRPKGLWTPIIDEENISYQSMFKPFSLNQYLYPRPPIDMGLVEYPPEGMPNILRMPLKFPGTDYRFPEEIGGALSLCMRIAEYEAFLNPKHDECFCHVTYDLSTVEAGTYHRFPGFHGDGIQGTKLTPKKIVEHSYILTGAPVTEWCLQPFFLRHLDEAKHNFFMEFDKQAKEANLYSSLPYHLYLIDPYMVHRTPRIDKKTERVFFRMTYAFTELQHPKNTVNPMFEGQEYEKRVDIRQNLCRNEFEIPYHLYGLSNERRT